SCTLFSEASSSPKKMRPAVGRSSPAISRKSVVLPDPDGPKSAISSPDPISSDTSCSAGNRSNSLRTCATRTSIHTSLSVTAAGSGDFIAEAPFQSGLEYQSNQGQEGEQRGQREGWHALVLIVKHLHLQRHGGGLAADLARNHGDGAEFTH